MANTYDFIIIGGGTSGLVLANRLTEDPNTNVLVVEAGQNYLEDPRVKTPALYTTLFGTDAHWNFETPPQAALNNRQISVSQGRALGGSSAVNAHIFVPPSKTVVDAWGKLGNPGWSWDIMQPYYAKIHSTPKLAPDLMKHLGIAPNISVPSERIQTSYGAGLEDPIPWAWNETIKRLGYLMPGDPFHGSPTGAFSNLSSIDPTTRERSYAATAYYVPAAKRKNLQVLTGCLVEKLLFDKSEPDLKILGIQYQYNGETVIANALQEVILAAGALGSPKVLELSGIGDRKLLEKLGIEVLVDNPYVGENLQDHIACGMGFEARDHITTIDGLVRQEPEVIEAAMAQYAATKTGPLSAAGLSAHAYLPVMGLLDGHGQAILKHLLDSNTPESLQATHPAAKQYYDITRSILENKNEASASFFPVPTQADGALDKSIGFLPGKFVSLSFCLSQPLSRGSVHITSTDILQSPTIDPRYLSNPIDEEIFARQLQYLEVLAKSEPFSSTILKPGGRRNALKVVENDLEAAKEYVRRNAKSIWHPTSTCAMLPREKGGVVNERLIVYGTKNLRIVDASVMPLITRGNTQTSAYAVAERAADLIKEDHGL